MHVPRIQALLDRDLRRQAMRVHGFRLASRLTPLIGVDHDGIRYVVSTRDSAGASFATFVSGPFEEDTLVDVLEHLGWSSLEGRTVLEVGANIGTETVSMVMRHHARAVLAFEPDRDNARLLRANLALNGIDDRVRVHDMALSDVDASLTMELSADNWGDHRVRPASEPGDRQLEPGRATTQVPARTLDSLSASGEVDVSAIDLVWMDAQGHEAHVLAGAAQPVGPVLADDRHAGQARRAGALERFDALAAQRTVVDLGTGGPYPADDFASNTNLLLLPRSPTRGSSSPQPIARS